MTVVSASTINAKYSVGPNSKASFTIRGATKVSAAVSDCAGHEGADSGRGQCLRAATLAGHCMAMKEPSQ